MRREVCFWCDGEGSLECVLCQRQIVCMFCAGDGKWSPEKKLPAHVCEAKLAAAKVEAHA